MSLKTKKISHHWGGQAVNIDYLQMDQFIIKEFKRQHPKVVKDWVPKVKGIFITDPNYKLTKKQSKHRIMLKLEKWFNLELSKKHFKLVK